MAQQQEEKYVYQFSGTVSYDGFNAAEDVKALREAMKGHGADEKEIIAIVTSRTNAQRQEIEKLYKETYGRDLKEDFKKELKGNFEDVVIALFYPPIEYDAHCLHQAMCGPGTDEEALIEILASRSNDQIKKIKVAYKEKYNEELEDAIKGDTRCHFQRMLVMLLTASREDYRCIDHEQAKEDAKDLYEAGEKKWGTDESRFNEIMCKRSFPQLRAVFKYYKDHCGNSIIEAIEKEFSGDMEMGLKTIAAISYYAPAYFARRIHRATKGIGTDDSTLIRVVVSRSEVDLQQINDGFLLLYEYTLAKCIKDDTSGDYKRILLELIGN